jgi:hypothetical protein
MMSMDLADPFTTHTTQGQQSMSLTEMLAKTSTPPLPLPSCANLAPRMPTPHIRTPEPERISTPVTVPPVLEPMVIERSPSPPLPDFHVDMGLV